MIESIYNGLRFQFDTIHGKGGRVPMVRIPLKNDLFFVFNDSHLEYFLVVKKLIDEDNYSNWKVWEEMGISKATGKGLLQRLRDYNPGLFELSDTLELDPYIQLSGLLEKIGFLSQEFLDRMRSNAQEIPVADRRGTRTF